MKTHHFSWNLNGTILPAPEANAWWLPYDRNAIMKFGNSVNGVIPPDPNMAEFPDEPWPKEVLILVRLSPNPRPGPPPSPVGGPPKSFTPPGSWQGPPPDQAPAISEAASGLADYTSPNSVQTIDGQPEESPDEALQAFRGFSEKDSLIHAMISWTTLESYPLRIGISLPVPNQILVDGEEVVHEAQLWEETEEEFMIEKNHAEFIYTWLSERLKSRSSTKILPERMPESVEEVAVQTIRDGNYGYIIFARSDSLAENMKRMDVQVVFEYGDGFMKVGMSESYTLRMLMDEFWYLTRESWEIFPTLPTKRNLDGAVVHEATENWTETKATLQREKKLKLPPKIIEDRGRGTLIRNAISQGKLLQYWARIEEEIEVGIFIPEETNGVPRNVEYWMNLTLQYAPNAKPDDYPGFLMDMCLQKTRMISNGVAQWLEGISDFRVETRYVFNKVRVWYCPKVVEGIQIFGSRIMRPMAEDPSPKDKWYAGSGVMAYTFPLTEKYTRSHRCSSVQGQFYRNGMTMKKFREAKLRSLQLSN
jgi:hypothetical protein